MVVGKSGSGKSTLIKTILNSNSNIKYNKVFQEDYDSKNKVKYLYKKGDTSNEQRK